jgi:hypothetical protein
LGFGNHAVATAELGISSGLSILAIALPLLSSIVVLMLLFFVARKGYQKLYKQRRTEAAL